LDFIAWQGSQLRFLHCFVCRDICSDLHTFSKRDMDFLPLEILVQIFGELDKKELLVAKRVCKPWYYFISADHLVWRVICMKKWSGRCNIAYYGGSWKHMLLDDNLRSKTMEWEWDVRKCGKGIHTFHNNRAALFQSPTSEPCQVLCSTPCTGEEKYYFEMEIVHTLRGAINIGVSLRNADVEHRCGFDGNGWSFSLFSGTLFHDQAWASQEGYAKPMFGKGSRIGMGIDMRRRTITFFFNGCNQGVFVDNIPSEVYPSVSLGDVGDCITILPTPSIPNF